MDDRSDAPELSLIPREQWDEARRRLPIVRTLAEKPRRKRAEVKAAAESLRLSTSQLYELLARYIADPRLTALLPRQRGGVCGRSRLSKELDTLIDEAIEEIYLSRQRATIMELVLEVRRRCHMKGLTPPGRTAIAARVHAKPAFETMKSREGSKAARDQFGPVTGSLETSRPLEVVQIDHTRVDVMVVDSTRRAPIQRPWLTLAVDVYSRCVLGFYLTLEPPSATSVALCLVQAILEKKYWLIERKLEAEWPVHGLMTRLHLDNAREFRSEALRRGCEQYGVEISYRPVRTPHYGGHIERLIGTMMGKVHLLPGTTFSDVQEKGDYNPEKDAAMTIEELERWLTLAITGTYHLFPHRALGTSPLAAWQQAMSGGAVRTELDPITDRRRLLIDFLPMERRQIRRDGVSLNRIHYWSDILRTWVGNETPMILRYDPRDLSRVYLLAPNGSYYDLHYRDLSRPPISLWEHRLALKRLREKGVSQFDERAIFRTVEQMRSIVDKAVVATKAARRQQERRLQVIRGGRTDPAKGKSKVDLSLVWTDEEGNGRQPWQDMLPVEEWDD